MRRNPIPPPCSMAWIQWMALETISSQAPKQKSSPAPSVLSSSPTVSRTSQSGLVARPSTTGKRGYPRIWYSIQTMSILLFRKSKENMLVMFVAMAYLAGLWMRRQQIDFSVRLVVIGMHVELVWRKMEGYLRMSITTCGSNCIRESLESTTK